jgi:hypothetical protein
VRFVLVLLFLTRTAAAQSTRDESYRGSLAVADALSVATLGTGVYLLTSTDGTGGRVVGVIATVIGGGGYIWASPIIHKMKGRDEWSKVDIGMRIIVPGMAAGIVAGTTACSKDDVDCEQALAPIILAGAGGIAVASAVDITFFGMRSVPYVAPTTAGGAVLGVAGAF